MARDFRDYEITSVAVTDVQSIIFKSAKMSDKCCSQSLDVRYIIGFTTF